MGGSNALYLGKGNGSIGMDGTLEEILDCKFHVAIRWIRLLQNGVTIKKYLEEKNISSIVVYGITDFALRILEDYKMTDSLDKIKAISDQKVTEGQETDFYGIPCVAPGEIEKYIDCETYIIVTPLGWHKEIKRELQEAGLKKVITIQELIYDMCLEMEKKCGT